MLELPLSRRELLTRSGGSFGAAALTWWLGQHLQAASAPDLNGGLHHRAKAKRVVQLFMNGGASPMDTFDYKPELKRLHGQKLGPKEKPEGFTGAVGAVMQSPFEFKQHGECGQWVSSVFPHQAQIVDDLAFLMAMTTKTNVHGPASYMMNTGFMLPGFPCLGAWISYALGNLADNLPTFVVLPDTRGLPYNQKGNFSCGFLPAKHQGTLVNATSKTPIPDLFADPQYQFAQGKADKVTFALLQQFNRQHATTRPDDSRLEARIAAGELAAKMQLSAPEAFDLSRETKETHAAYGLDQKETEDFGRRALLARRLLERGTRFVQVWSGPQGAVNNWDNHGNIKTELPAIARSADQPIAALFRDLKARGLLEDTLVIWTTEFGRTPFAQGSEGRDHNRGTFVTWLGGAGVKAGTSYGKSDDLAYQTAENKTYCYDLHATILHLLGIDHTRLTFRTAGIDRRLTDVHGHVVHDILA
ncbi:DUF1501 domain-containing protein [Gimesia chilikensis]|uniref:DUF1501 domain-containing protein n=1 Tax=Gimesia chilikensis TaxID=2605989 RepID=A0A517PQF9_9PLAN|nr:DUF1501 domain-containing protein [Gimesia chilikensis]QDT21612.1 hypothetical protein HG66A1_34150 [Gimesia chilikensis]